MCQVKPFVKFFNIIFNIFAFKDFHITWNIIEYQQKNDSL